MKATWKEVKTYIQTGLPENTFSLWINPITFLEDGDNTVVLGCPNKFSSNWVEENFSREPASGAAVPDPRRT